MSTMYTAVIQHDDRWWIGWVKEIPGINAQGRTREELLSNLRSALNEALEMNCAEAVAATTGVYEEVKLEV
jgi:predicted RNase H-like HicB family nuclease